MAHEVLGDKVVALSASTPTVPEQERRDAQNFCREYGITQELCSPDVLSIEGVYNNEPDRCYVCKKGIFAELFGLAKKHGIAHIADGSNVDDLSDYRPGHKALKELGVVSPLLEAGLTKSDIRALSRRFGLSTWNKQSNACLATRFPYHTLLTEEKLSMVDKAESFVRGLGFEQLRVRVHEDIARIEIPSEQFQVLLNQEKREMLIESLKQLGFAYVTLDLAGYRSGSMDEPLSLESKD